MCFMYDLKKRERVSSGFIQLFSNQDFGPCIQALLEIKPKHYTTYLGNQLAYLRRS